MRVQGVVEMYPWRCTPLESCLLVGEHSHGTPLNGIHSIVLFLCLFSVISYSPSSCKGIVDDNKRSRTWSLIVGGTGIFNGASGTVSQYTLVNNPRARESSNTLRPSTSGTPTGLCSSNLNVEQCQSDIASP